MNQKFLLLFTLILLFALNGNAEETNAQKKEKTKIALLGDSMTWLGGDRFDNPKGWTYYMSDRPVEMKLYARSGATWTNTTHTRKDTDFYTDILDDSNVIYNQVCRLIQDVNPCEEKNETFKPDIIIVYAGANDAWFNDRRPGIFDVVSTSLEEINLTALPSDYTTLAGSIYLSGKLLKENFPESSIFLVTPVNGAKMTEENIERVSDIIERAGTELGMEVIRADREVPFSRAVESGPDKQYTYDGVHSNEKGARKIAEVIKTHIFNKN